MNRGAVKTAAAANGRFNATVQASQLTDWVDAAYEWVWYRERWSFRRADEIELVVSPGQDGFSFSDAREVRQILDNNGDPLVEYDTLEFRRAFAEDLLNGKTGQPSAYTVMDDSDGSKTAKWNVISDGSYTFPCQIERAVQHRTSAGAATNGLWNDDTDLPYWPNHHLLIAYQACLFGLGAENDDSSLTLMRWRDELLDSMRRDYLPDGPPVIFGSRRAQPRRRLGR